MNSQEVQITPEDIAAAEEASSTYPKHREAVFAAVLAARLIGAPRPQTPHDNTPESLHETKPMAPAEFFARLKPTHDTDRVLGAAYFLDRFKGLADFTGNTIRECLIEAKMPPPDNLSLAALRNSRNGFMAQKSKEGVKISWFLTQTGMDKVEGLLRAAERTEKKIQNGGS